MVPSDAPSGGLSHGTGTNHASRGVFRAMLFEDDPCVPILWLRSTHEANSSPPAQPAVNAGQTTQASKRTRPLVSRVLSPKGSTRGPVTRFWSPPVVGFHASSLSRYRSLVTSSLRNFSCRWASHRRPNLSCAARRITTQ